MVASWTIELRNYCDEDACECLVRPRANLSDPNLIENYERLSPNYILVGIQTLINVIIGVEPSPFV